MSFRDDSTNNKKKNALKPKKGKRRKKCNEIELFCHAGIGAGVRKDTKFQSCVSLKLSVIHKTYRFPTKAIWLVFYAITTTNRKRAALSAISCVILYLVLISVIVFFLLSIHFFLNYRCSNRAFFVSYCFIYYWCCCGCSNFYCHIQFNPLNDARQVKKECVFCDLFCWNFILHVIQNG